MAHTTEQSALVWLFFCLTIVFVGVEDVATTSSSVIIQSLEGNDWKATNQNQSIHIQSVVPGSIYTDLNKANVIKGNILDNFNDLEYRWVSYDNWTFVKQFNVNQSVLSREKIFLTCHGLDTVGDVFLNGHWLGSVENSFIRYKWSIKGILIPQANEISVSFRSAPVHALQYYIKTLVDKYSIPPVCVPREQNGECHVNFLRKMQSSFSWDWGPAFPTQGIWQPIEIEAYSSVNLRSISVQTDQNKDNLWSLSAKVWLESTALSRSTGNVALYLDDLLLSQQKYVAQFDNNGDCPVDIHVNLSPEHDIKPWFPNGMGTQYLYKLTVNVTSQNQETVNKTINIGFRTVELVQKKISSQNEAYSFYFTVNNVPIFAKGSNWIPANVLHEQYNKDYIRDLLISAKLANMNMIRVWGGGVYEDDWFYEMTDEYGILVWQDMMFACALYPIDQKFMSSVSTEITQQVRRLQYHPSIVVWAGNNENEAAIAQGWWPEIFLHMRDYHDDYRALYVKTMMPIVQHEDKTRPFLTSSPSNGVDTVRENYISSNPQDNRFGDVHFYVFDNSDGWDWRTYPSSKFVSEYGFQSLSSLKTLQKYISKEYLKYPFTDGLIHREHKTGGILSLIMSMEQHLPKPTGFDVKSLDDFIYLSQVFQSMAIKIQTEFYRRNRNITESGTGLTMGALYWQLNDIWPSFSWSSVEYGGKWKMLHYYARNMFDNLIVDAFIENELFKVAIIRDDHIPKQIDFDLNIEVYSWSSMTPIYSHQTIQTSTKPFSVELAYQQRMDQLSRTAKCPSSNHCFIQVSISTQINGETIERKNFLLLDRIKNAVGLTKANIQVGLVSGPVRDEYDVNEFRIELESDKIAPFVWIDFNPELSISGIFSDNGFFITNHTTVVFFRTHDQLSSGELAMSLTIKSLKDVN